MGEPAEQPTEPEEETPVGVPEEPQEPTEASGEGEMPPEGGGSSEEPETPPVGQTAAASDKEMGDAFKKLEKEATRHANRVSEIVGEAAQDLVVCELCEPMFAGFHWPVPPDEERKEAVRAAIGDVAPRELRPDRHASACPECDGEGVVATGSKMEGQAALPCMACQGKGWVGDRAAPLAPSPSLAVAPVEGNGPPPPSFSPQDLAEAERLKALGMFVVVPERTT